MFETTLFTTLISITCATAMAQNRNVLDTVHARSVIEVLASDSFQGRNPATPAIQLSVDFLIGQYKKADLYPAFGKTYLQPFVYATGNDSVSANNIVGFVEKPDPKKKTILLCAHYDHLGKEIKYSRDPFSNDIHNGADDNACGVAMILELARELKRNGKSCFNYLIVAFSGHETGLHGSSFYSRCDLNVKYPPTLVLNFDLIGRMELASRTLIVCHNNLNDSLGSRILDIDSNLTLKSDTTRINSGDHTVFSQMGVQIIFLTCGLHDDYHKPTDDADKINYTGLQLIFNYTMNIINYCEGQEKIFSASRCKIRR